MRNFKYILLLFGCTIVTLLQSCDRGEDSHDPINTRLANITIDVQSSSVATRASENISSLAEDYTIATLRIFAVDEYGLVEVNEFVDNVQSINGSAQYSFDVVQSAKKRLYVVVNEPSSLTEKLSAVRHQSELTMLSYQIAESLNNEQFIAGEPLGDTNKMIPMCAVQEINATADQDIVIRVDRVVARVDLMVDKDEVAYAQSVEFNSSTTVSVSGLYYTTSLFKPSQLPTPTSSQLQSEGGVALSSTVSLDLESESRDSAKRLLSFYMAERTYSITPGSPSDNRIAINIDNITVDGQIKAINSIILLGNNVQPYIEQINRNHVYRIFATYNGEEQSLEVSNEYAIVDWSVEMLDGDIEGVMSSREPGSDGLGAPKQ